MTEINILERLIKNDTVFNNLFVIHQNFDIIPHQNKHYGVSIDYQDISELKNEFLYELYYSIVDWVYSSERYEELKKAAMLMGRSEAAANAAILKKAHDKFRGNRDSENLLLQGQIGELLLFHFIQKYK